jgi:8-oxo-dGTP pyrophosphatase MutT (NUDIX family)
MTKPAKIPNEAPSMPARLYALVPYVQLAGTLEQGLEPAVLRESRGEARARPGRGLARVTVYARDARREGVDLRRVEGGWEPAGRIEPHLLACRDRRALRALGVKQKVSAGGLIVSALDDPRVMLMFRRKGEATAWKTPKGGVGRGETLKRAALREVREEAGLERVRVLGRLGRMQYFKRRPDGRLSEKTVHLFLMLSEDGETAISPREGEHFVSCEWLEPAEAITRVTQPQARRLIARAQRRLAARAR